LLVKDGIIYTEEMNNARITRQQLFEVIREKEIYNLGNVERVYLEACGIFSVYQREKQFAGLSILPPGDTSVFNERPTAEGFSACKNCGYTAKLTADTTCPSCGKIEWEKAVME